MKRFIIAVLMLCTFTAAAFAQGTTGRLVGTVTGPDGSIAGATVTVTDTQTNREFTTQSGDDGTFRVEQLEFGVYTVSITAPGFSTYLATELKIDAGQDYSLNPTLQVGEITSTVEVIAGADVVNSTDGQLSTTVTPRQVKELPINGRNPLALLNLIAGSNPTSGSINGQRSSSVNYTRDGLNVQDNFIRNGFVQDQPTVDDTGEFTVITQNAGAEYGTGSTQVQLVTPRGGADFSGALVAFNRNSYFGANSFFNNLNVNAQGVGVPRAFLNRNQFGGTLSGPVALPRFGEGGPATIRNKAFFFVNYEGFRLANQVSAAATTLLPESRNGTFTYLDNTNTQRTVNVLTGAGLTGAPAGGALQVDPLIQSRFLSQLPNTGNGVLTGINFLQTVNFNRSNPETRNAVTGRFDLDFNESNTFNFVYKYNKNADARTDIAAGFSPGTFADQGGPTTLYVLAYRSTPTANFSNEIRGGYQRSEPFFRATNSPLNLPFLVAVPFITNPEASFQDQGRNTDYYNIQDNASYTIGNHAIRFGGQFQGYRIQSTGNGGITPTFSITGTANPLAPTIAQNLFPGGINNTDFARANNLRFLLAGVVGSGQQTANATSQTSGFVSGAASVRTLNYDNIAGYIQDQWRVTPQLTLNFGLRYELYTPLRDPNGLSLEPIIPAGVDPRAAILSPTGGLQFVGGNAGNPGDFFKADKNNFGPNVSFAYSPTFKNNLLGSLFSGEGRTVFRGGFRVGYVNDEYVRAPDNALLNNIGLGSNTALARVGGDLSGSSQLNVIGLGNVQAQAPIVAPLSAFGPGGSGTRTFLENNIAGGGGGGGQLGGTISVVDPNLQVQRTYEYNVGFQREIGFQSAIEINYVGGRSNQLVRSLDLNQVDIRRGGFLEDFNRARQNIALVDARRAAINADTTLTAAQRTAQLATVPLTAAFNATLPGSQALTVFPTLVSGGFINNNAVLTQLRNGTPADLVASVYIPNGINASNFLANPNAGVVNILTNGGEYNYNSLQAEFRRRFSQGLSLQANYTFQKILTNVTGSDEFNQTRVEPLLDNANPRLDYARPLYDRAHTFNFNGIYELPFGTGKRFLSGGGALDRIFGGFQFNSIVNISSGRPVSIIDARGTLNRAGRSGLQPASSSLTRDQIKDLVGIFKTPNGVFYIDPSVLFAEARNAATGQTMTGVDLTQQLPAGFTVTTVRGANPVGTAPFAGQVFFPNEPGSTGNLSRNFINGPLYLNWDAGLFKNIRITENSRLQLRAELFNVLNRANFFSSAAFDVGSLNFGRITTTYDPRIVQFGVRYDF